MQTPISHEALEERIREFEIPKVTPFVPRDGPAIVVDVPMLDLGGLHIQGFTFFLQRQPRVSFRRAKLENCAFIGTDLRNFNFYGTQLTNCTFHLCAPFEEGLFKHAILNQCYPDEPTPPTVSANQGQTLRALVRLARNHHVSPGEVCAFTSLTEMEILALLDSELGASVAVSGDSSRRTPGELSFSLWGRDYRGSASEREWHVVFRHPAE